jgi:acyl-CoA synthetase (AMP-forming)/AMP-acid ligase II
MLGPPFLDARGGASVPAVQAVADASSFGRPVPSPAALAPEPRLVDRLAARWAEDPGAPALRWRQWPAGRWWRRGELAERVAGWAEGLARLGVGPGQRVLWLGTSTPEQVLGVLGVLWAGASVVPANPKLTPRELAHLLGDAEPQAVLAEPAQEADLHAAAELAGRPLPRLLRPALSGPVPASGVAAGPGRPGLGTAGGASSGAGGDEPAPALVVYTSGTTGAPKGALLDQANLLANAAALAWAWEWTPEDRLVHCLPVFHVHGLCVGLLDSLAVGAQVVLLPGFDPAGLVEALAEERASLFFGVPTMYHRLVEARLAEHLARLRLAVAGSAALAPGLHRQLVAAGVPLVVRYGMSETLMLTSTPPAAPARPGSVGVCLPGVEAAVDESGEVWVRGASVGPGYWRRPEATAASRRDGWFRTGDHGRLDPDGWLTLLGRAGDVVISGGYNVYPAEVEEVLAGYPGVAEVAVGGRPSAEWGEVVTAWVVPRPGTELVPEELLAWAAERLAPYKRPRELRVVASLPRNAMGKLLRHALR